MVSFIHFLFLSFLFFFVSSSAAKSVPIGPKGLVLPVFKDKCSKQYITQFYQRTPSVPVKLTLDLGGAFTWVDCDNYVSSSYRPVSCSSDLCTLATGSNACGSECYSSPKPGCYNNSCGRIPYNPVLHLSTSGEIGQDVVSLQSFNGKIPGGNITAPKVPFICTSGFMLENLADGVSGIAALGRSNVSLPVSLSSAFGFPKKFAVCLSSLTNSSGVIFFGDGPYSIIPTNLLTYTPLIRNPVSTAGAYYEGDASTDYFIGLKSIRVGGKEVKLNRTLLSIDKEGKGGTMISTVHPYTVLHTSIYKPVLKAFIKQMDRYIAAEPPVPPFGACFQYSSEYDVDQFGPKVPFIDLVMEAQGSVYWRIWGSNSMVRISSLVMCLGFVDGGFEPRSSIVIGGHQVEDNLLQFDLASFRLGFSSTLAARNTTCSKFHFKSA